MKPALVKPVPRAPAWVAAMLSCICVLLGCAVLAPGALAAKPSVSGIRLGVHPHQTRVVVDLSAAADYRVFALADPPRIVIDLSDTELELGEDQMPAQRGLVEAVRAGRPAPGTSRITLDLAAPARVAQVQLLAGSALRPCRLVVDLESGAPEDGGIGASAVAGGPPLAEAPMEVASTAPPAGPTKPQAPAKPSVIAAGASDVPSVAVPAGPGDQLAALPVAAVLPAASAPEPVPVATPVATLPLPPPKPAGGSGPDGGSEKPLVVIDPGHGGIDPGTIGVSGVEEKGITLAVSLAVRDALLATGDYRVQLTREDDRYIRLRDRFELARTAGAKLFVSLHADSHPDALTRGASVYTLSEKASDRETAALAARENESDLLVPIDPSVHDPMVGSILLDMRRWKTLEYSAAFAEDMVSQLGRETRLLRNTHRSAGFAVLKAPDVPSVLIELGYLSNSKDEKLLSTPKHQAVLAAAIVRGIQEYFRKHPQQARLNAPGTGNKFPG